MNQNRDRVFAAQCTETSGPWPFITRRIHRRADGSLTAWSSRHHRKGLVLPAAVKAVAITETLLRCLFNPSSLNWWIGIVFAMGSLLFALASVLSLSPVVAAWWSMKPATINALFFAGSIPFTTAAYLQLFQAANAGDFLANHPGSRQRLSLLGWRPHAIGWLSCALQFVGTILFNFNTFDALLPSLTWLQQDLVIWAPNIVGSVLFLASGYLAFIETCHAHWAWKPASLSWWVVFTNLLGCVGFMLSALFAMFLPGPANLERITLSIVFTLFGAIGFLVGSLLLLPESVLESRS